MLVVFLARLLVGGQERGHVRERPLVVVACAVKLTARVVAHCVYVRAGGSWARPAASVGWRVFLRAPVCRVPGFSVVVPRRAVLPRYLRGNVFL